MIIKLGYVDSYINGLQQLAAKKLPVKLSYMIAANLKILTEKREDIEKQRISIFIWCNFKSYFQMDGRMG